MCRTSRAAHLKNSLFFLSTISALKPPAPPPCISAVTAPDSSRLHTTRQRRRSLPSDTNPNHNPHATRHSTHLQIMTALSGSSPLASKLHSTLAYLPRDETHHTCARTWHGHGGDAQRVRRALAPPLLQQHVSDVAQPQQLGERGVVHAAAEQQAAVTQLICDAARRVLRFLREVWGAAGGDARQGACTAHGTLCGALRWTRKSSRRCTSARCAAPLSPSSAYLQGGGGYTRVHTGRGARTGSGGLDAWRG